MLEITCRGNPYEIGFQHGKRQRDQVNGSIDFYRRFLTAKTGLSWQEIRETASKFIPMLRHHWSFYLEEIEGLAKGADVAFESILVLNVRTEIAFGMVSDGCTALSWKANGRSYLAQNWDWDSLQSSNIIKLLIEQPSKPSIHMMTEAGILGKIGLNSDGVGVTLNAVQAKGVDFNRLPTHLALRTVMECESQKAAVEKLCKAGVAASCHITISDAVSGGIGLEFSAYDVVQILPNDSGICTHTNHFIRSHAVPSKIFLLDSITRLERVNNLLENSGPTPSTENIAAILKDRDNYPGAICRGPSEKHPTQTLFSIIMDLSKRYAIVKMGQPTEDGEEFELRP